MRDLADRKANKIEAKMHGITLEQTIERFGEYINTVRFGMFQGLYNKFRSRYDMVVHFMAILELSKQHTLKIYQQDMMGPLWVYRADLDESVLPVAEPTVMHEAATDATIVDVQAKVTVVDVPKAGLIPAPDVTAENDFNSPSQGISQSEPSEVDP